MSWLTRKIEAVRNRSANGGEAVRVPGGSGAEPVPNRSNAPLCSAVNAAGNPCRGIAVGGSGLCLAHQPDGRERMAKIGRRGGQARERSESELAIAAGMADTLAMDALLEVVRDPFAKQANVVRAAEAVWARAPGTVRVEGTGGVEEVRGTYQAAAGSQGPLSGQGFVPPQSAPPEVTPTQDSTDDAPPESQLEDLAAIQWRNLHPNGRPYRPRRGRSHGIGRIEGKDITG